MTDSDEARPFVYQAGLFIQTNAPVALLAHAYFYAVPVAQPEPWVDIRWKLLAKGDDVIARAPTKAVGDGRKPIRSVPQEGDLRGACADHRSSQRARSLLHHAPASIMKRA